MTNHDYNELAVNAGESAAGLLHDAFERVQVFLEYHDKLTPAEAILTIGLARLTQRDLHYEEMRAPAVTAGDNGNESERHRQAALDYDWLKWLVSVALPNPSDAEYCEVQARIRRLAGL